MATTIGQAIKWDFERKKEESQPNEFTPLNMGLQNNSITENYDAIHFSSVNISLGHGYAGSITWWPLH